jgi:hypothetical protein
MMVLSEVAIERAARKVSASPGPRSATWGSRKIMFAPGVGETSPLGGFLSDVPEEGGVSGLVGKLPGDWLGHLGGGTAGPLAAISYNAATARHTFSSL